VSPGTTLFPPPAEESARVNRETKPFPSWVREVTVGEGDHGYAPLPITTEEGTRI